MVQYLYLRDLKKKKKNPYVENEWEKKLWNQVIENVGDHFHTVLIMVLKK